MMKKISSVFVFILSLSLMSVLSVSPALAEGTSTMRTKVVETVVKTKSLNLRAGPGTKYSIIKKLPKNTVVVKTNKKSGKWVQVKALKKTGWVHSSYLTTKTTIKYVPVESHKASATEQKEWTKSLPKVCQKVEIRSIIHTNKNDTTKYNIYATTEYNTNGTMYYTLNINGKVGPNDQSSVALMKHECGHVLMNIYQQDKGTKAFSTLLNKGWKSSNTLRIENAADCISDQLGAVREGKNYTVGYGTVCSATQKDIAKTITNYSVNKR